MTLTITPEAGAGTTYGNAEAVKTCRGRCGRTLPLSSFTADRTRKDGRRGDCKECYRARREDQLKAEQQVIALERELLSLLGAYTTPSLADVLARALEEVRQIGATGDRRAEQVEAVRLAVLIHGCRRVEEAVEETHLSRWAVDHALAELVDAGELETRDAFRLGDESEEAGRPAVEYHPRAYPRGDGFRRFFRRDDDPETPEVEP